MTISCNSVVQNAINAAAANAINVDMTKKIVGAMKSVMNKPGDKVEPKTHEGMPNGMSRETFHVHGEWDENDRESPDIRIEKAIKRVMDVAHVPCVGRGIRPMNDGSFDGNVTFMA